MTKVQEVKRKNGTIVMNIFLPQDISRSSGFFKGDEVNVSVESPGVIRISKVLK